MSVQNYVNKTKIIVLDGGFSTQLSRHVQNPIDGDPLWTARYLATDPEAIINTHLDYLNAGADLIETCTYQASISGFMQHLNLSQEESYKLIKKAVSLARIACERYQKAHPEDDRRRLIVGSVGPYGAFLHDCSEYSGTYAKTVPVEVMREWHKPRIDALVEAGIDLLAFETVPCRVEAEMLVNLLKEYPETQAWLAFSGKDDGKLISSGENFQETAKYCYKLNPNQLVAVGLNCTTPTAIGNFFEGINDGEDDPIPLINYPNSGEEFNAEEGWTGGGLCEPLCTYVQDWLDLGVTWIGGCCRTYAEDIKKIKEEVNRYKNK